MSSWHLGPALERFLLLCDLDVPRVLFYRGLAIVSYAPNPPQKCASCLSASLLYVCMHACMHACMHVCMHVCMYIYIYVLCVYRYIEAIVSLYIYMYIHVYVYVCYLTRLRLAAIKALGFRGAVGQQKRRGHGRAPGPEAPRQGRSTKGRASSRQTRADPRPPRSIVGTP